jgi:hypothetical protein
MSKTPPPPAAATDDYDLNDYYDDLGEAAEQEFAQYALGDLCVREIKKLLTEDNLKFQAIENSRQSRVSLIKQAVLPYLQRWYVCGVDAGARSILSPVSASKEDTLEREKLLRQQEAFDDHGWTRHPDIPDPKPLLERMFNEKGTKRALDILAEHEGLLFNEGYGAGFVAGTNHLEGSTPTQTPG